ncbi:glucosylceramidase [Cephus cinctus]|uniref:Glucosylceramidase n=1 Tax=Cephus cinctus TaxID=211228 RepID=A0AAJ7R733_CEPCN|nr:glucosylceramidase [Cephus cinctus]XP_015610471.1 glucosylceramidase [Cephus cinctus]XP_015610472.1 glucosylceramidase [Cephus cinctus]XP_015610473.1 glucosylceramidase [Cephus cinctus]XP_015610474.1 glucosylceramidase [Cephus cinctus]XP_024935483.1 glucosylceramidase [Cephus cinctus]XP_024935484.1 glucosylceramidase [Cephus cinctus]
MGSFVLFGIFMSVLLIVNTQDCVPRDFGNGGTVCVCNSTYCDVTPDPILPETGNLLRYVSSKNGLRLNLIEEKFSNQSIGDVKLILNRSIMYQTIHGFGGAFTDSAGINIKNLSAGAQDKLMESYFSTNGSKYSFGRVPIAGTDFSTRSYTYDDVPGDTTLSKFSLAQEDFLYKIPLIQKALELNSNLRLFASSWTAPPWMKTNNQYNKFGFLKTDYYQTYVDYLIKFLKEYKKHGLEMWGITTGNEPFNAFIFSSISNTGWTANTLKKWIAKNLGPTLRASEFKGTKIMAVEDQRWALPWFPQKIFRNEIVKNYTDAIAFHWYVDKYIPASVLDMTHDKFPDKFIIMTEACIGSSPFDGAKVLIGSWSRGEEYVSNIIENLSHWVTGWVDWNLALNEQGGPNWIENYVDSPIIVNAENDEFYKQPMYYALAHFSKFIPPNSRRIELTASTDVKSLSVTTPNDETVIVLYNKSRRAKTVSISDPDRGYINAELPGNSIHTIIYK